MKRSHGCWRLPTAVLVLACAPQVACGRKAPAPPAPAEAATPAPSGPTAASNQPIEEVPGWNVLRLGMTLDEARAALRGEGAAFEEKEDLREGGTRLTLDAHGWNGTVWFGSPDRLSQILFESPELRTGQDGEDRRRQMEARLGPPAATAVTAMHRWRNRDTTATVTVVPDESGWRVREEWVADDRPGAGATPTQFDGVTGWSPLRWGMTLEEAREALATAGIGDVRTAGPPDAVPPSLSACANCPGARPAGTLQFHASGRPARADFSADLGLRQVVVVGPSFAAEKELRDWLTNEPVRRFGPAHESETTTRYEWRDASTLATLSIQASAPHGTWKVREEYVPAAE